MISPDQRKILNDLGKTQYGFALRKYLKEKYEKINDISSVTTWEETLGRQYALKTLKEIFSFIDDGTDAKRATPPVDFLAEHGTKIDVV